MTTLTSFALINEWVRRIKENDPTLSPGQAFMKLALSSILKINEEDIEDSITDGKSDGEIDAIYIIDNFVHIFTFKYTDIFDNTKKNYPETEVDQFIYTLNLIIRGDLEESTINPAVWEKYLEIRELVEKGENGAPIFKIYIVSNKLQPVENSKRKLTQCLDLLNIADPPIYYDQERFSEEHINKKQRKNDGAISLVDRQYFDRSTGNIRTIIGVVAATELLNLICDEKRLIKEEVFDENVRVYKAGHQVNNAIIESAAGESNFEFFYLNNGVTILCESANYTTNARSPKVQIKNFQIINGGQTSRSLFEVSKRHGLDRLDNIEILVRICIVPLGEQIKDKISASTNSQIPIGSRDLRSNDMVQKKLEDEFQALGHLYERKPNQYREEKSQQVLNNELLGQLFMSYHLGMPSEAKNSKSKVFSDEYDKIFNQDKITARELLRLYNIYQPLLQKKKDIQSRKRQREAIDEKEAFISRATFHIIYAMKFFFERDISINYPNIKQSTKMEEVKDELFRQKREEFAIKAIRLIGEITEIESQKRGNIYTHDKFFKEIPTNNIIKNYVLKRLNDDDMN